MIYIAGSVNGTGNGFVRTSTDGGSTWTDIYTAPNGSEYFEDLTYSGQFLIAAGFNHNVWATQLSSQPSSEVLKVTITISQGTVALQWQTQTGKTYQVQSSLDLTTWNDFGSAVAGDGSIKTVYDNPGTTPNKFYRVVYYRSLFTLSLLYQAPD